MNNYDKMKELIQENRLQEALLLAFSNSLKLKITTKSKSDEENAIETIINLLRGVTNRVSNPELINNSETKNLEEIDIVNFHEQQKKSAYELWHKNRETIALILQIIAGNSIEISSPKKRENKVTTIPPEGETLEKFDELDFEQDNNYESFEVEENSLEEDSWVNGIVDDIVGEEVEEIISEEDGYSLQEEIISEEKKFQEESWDNFPMEEDNPEEVIINPEEENWDEFMDSDYSEDSVVNNNGAFSDNSGDEGEWQEWLEEESPLGEDEDSIINENEVIETDSANLEVGDEWQEWLEDENNDENNENNITMEEDMEEIDWGDEDWEEEKVN